MPRHSTAALTLAAALAMAPAPSGAQDVLGACTADIGTYCAAVEPGHGRMLACLYAHETVISAACDGAIGDLADVLDGFFAEVRYALQQCAPDIRAHCADVALGGGRIYRCLADQTALTPDCGTVMSTLSPPDG